MRRFSKSWKSSKNPRKQRKYRRNAPLHIRHRMVSAHLSKELRQKYGRRSFPLRKGDKVKVMVGKFRGQTGTIDRIDLKELKVYISGIEIIKKDGTKIVPKVDPSNLMITDFNLSDKKRELSLKKEKQKLRKKEENKAEKKSER
ncbi:MAG: 50S ribosomal protein L24 [Candidatus Woesearchaeota archaeon]|nr:50S ribosomal protein L24 [Candidatus Woesearchaeota archaeon]